LNNKNGFHDVHFDFIPNDVCSHKFIFLNLAVAFLPYFPKHKSRKEFLGVIENRIGEGCGSTMPYRSWESISQAIRGAEEERSLVPND